MTSKVSLNEAVAAASAGFSGRRDPMPAAYDPNYRRLQEIKTKYDPNNFFHLNQNIRPLA